LKFGQAERTRRTDCKKAGRLERGGLGGGGKQGQSHSTCVHFVWDDPVFSFDNNNG